MPRSVGNAGWTPPGPCSAFRFTKGKFTYSSSSDADAEICTESNADIASAHVVAAANTSRAQRRRRTPAPRFIRISIPVLRSAPPRSIAESYLLCSKITESGRKSKFRINISAATEAIADENLLPRIVGIETHSTSDRPAIRAPIYVSHPLRLQFIFSSLADY